MDLDDEYLYVKHMIDRLDTVALNALAANLHTYPGQLCFKWHCRHLSLRERNGRELYYVYVMSLIVQNRSCTILYTRR